MDFSKFLNIKTFALEYCKIGEFINSFTFPDSLQEISLSNNGIEYIKKIKFPENIKRLGMTSERLEIVSTTSFPQSLKELDLSFNDIQKLDIASNKFGESLRIDILDLRGNDLTLSKCKFPSTLRYLAMEDFVQDEAFHFSDSLCILQLGMCEFKNPHTINIGSNLKSLEILDGSLTHFNSNLPETLEDINISRNQLTEVPVQLCLLRNLKRLSALHNKIKNVYLNFLIST